MDTTSVGRRLLQFKAPYSLICPNCTHSNAALTTECRYCAAHWSREEAEAAANSVGVRLQDLEAESASGVPLGPLAMLFGFSGRLAVVPFWVAVALLGLSVFLIDMASESGHGAVRALSYALWMPVVWSVFAVTAKRLHDFDATGAWVAVLGLPVVGVIAAVAIGLIPGSTGANRFGPKGNTSVHPAASA